MRGLLQLFEENVHDFSRESIPIYDAQGYFVENELDHYSINGFMLESGRLHTEANELVIYVQHEHPMAPERVQNWLPAPEGACVLRRDSTVSAGRWSTGPMTCPRSSPRKGNGFKPCLHTDRLERLDRELRSQRLLADL
ncbi:DUF1214 domain-containing protein [Halorussus halophilus]|uniref:DUF1214 domain-containing protein n=1 Tax=Halorussus halophilus TaxID=2650975 RepID=UPI001CE470A5|nr:DUF1214 domain-containing protein [Halorussus halophilus]